MLHKEASCTMCMTEELDHQQGSLNANDFQKFVHTSPVVQVSCSLGSPSTNRDYFPYGQFILNGLAK